MPIIFKYITVVILVNLVVNCCLCFNQNDKQDYENEKSLRQNLQRNVSDNRIMPSHHHHPIVVAVELIIISLRDLDEKTECLTIDAWLQMKWNDTRLSWNETTYGGLTSINLLSHEMWHPEIKLYNRVKLAEIDSQKDVSAKVQSTGEVEWILPSTFTSACSMDLKFYPFDIQKCILTFGPWNENAHDIDMELLRPDGTMEFADYFNENNQWEVVNNRSWKDIKYFSCCAEPYSDISFELELRRRSPYYKYIILFPVLGCTALMLLIFWLPPNAVDKIVLSSTCFLSLVIILLHLSFKLPPAGKTVPMIVIFCGHLTLIVVISTVMAIVSIVWSRTEYVHPPPKWLTSNLNSICGKLLCIALPRLPVALHQNDECISMETDEDIKSDSRDTDRHTYYTQQWIQCFHMLDRIMFFILTAVVSFALAGSFTFNQ
ncbi:hypothetical protein CHUAL_000637 [Chamberlinius hualienensis]